jgi:tripartite-type tricarboxylate transporter receptor subunit TctC
MRDMRDLHFSNHRRKASRITGTKTSLITGGIMFKTVAKLFALVIAAFAMIAPTHAQTFPERSVKIVVPYPPGAFNDSLARMSSEKLTKLWNQTVVVENKPGGNTTIGNNYVAKSPGDGYTILITPLPFSALPALYGKKLPYDALNDFQALILAGSAQNVLATRKDLGLKDVNDLIAYAKKNPGKLNYGSTGSGSSNHLSMELLMSMTGIKLTHVPYKGSAPAVTALMAGEIDVLFDNIPNIIGQIKAGTVTPIAVTGLKPSALLPGVPTVSETGAPGFEVNVWFGMQVPAATPKAVVDQINRQLAAIFREPDTAKRFTDAGVEVVASTPEEFSVLLKSEVAKWGKVVEDANIKIE